MSIRIAVLLGGAALSGSLRATQLSSLVSGADAVVVGTESTATASGRTVTFYLTVERVLAGDIQTGATVNVVWDSGYDQDVPASSPNYRGIWFLRNGASGNWECISAGAAGNAEFFFELSLPVSQGPLPPQLAYDAGNTTLADQIILETAAGPPRADPYMFLDVVSDMSSPATLRAFRYLATSQTGDSSLAGIAGLIHAGDTGGLLSAEALSSTLTTISNGSGMVNSAIKLFFRSPDPVAVASLGRMATSGKASPLMQETAAEAIVAIHTAAAVPWFGLMLNSPSTEMQIHGAQGLSFFVNGVGIPTPQIMPTLGHLNNRQPSSYRTPDTDRNIGYKTGQPGPFVQFWQSWWAQHPELHVSVAAQ